MKRICFRCGYETIPKRWWSQNASLHYMGCANCSCGVFLHVPNVDMKKLRSATA